MTVGAANTHQDVGDEGEVWFGESAVDKMRAWADKNLPRRTATSAPLRVLECGSGNGTLLLSFLSSPGDEPQSFHLTGIDYSSGAAKLGASIEASRRESLADELDEDEEVLNEATCEWRVGDLLRDDFPEMWDLVMDKGTFDALALSQEPVDESGGQLPSRVYPERIARLVKPGGFFLITSCNFTEDEVKKRYTAPGVPFTFQWVGGGVGLGWGDTDLHPARASRTARSRLAARPARRSAPWRSRGTRTPLRPPAPTRFMPASTFVLVHRSRLRRR